MLRANRDRPAHVFDTATLELALWEAYKAATLRLDATPEPIDIRIGWRRRKLDKLLDRHQVTDWAFVSASNPASVVLSAAENDRRHRALIRQVESDRLSWPPGRGIGDSWSEESLLILGCSEAKAIALGRRFGQLAIVVGRRDDAARLVSCR